MSGELSASVWTTPDHGMIFSVAVPLQRYKQVLGAVMLSQRRREIEAAIRTVRLDMLQIFAVALAGDGAAVVLSRRHDRAADPPAGGGGGACRRGHGRHLEIPDFSRRGDEIGDLSGALREMTDALWLRMNAIESFAADVAHEIKNPLTSLRSAVETVARMRDPDKQRRLMAIIQDDVERLDRLITDISDASRLDAELSRLEVGTGRYRAMLRTLVDIHEDHGGRARRAAHPAGTADRGRSDRAGHRRPAVAGLPEHHRQRGVVLPARRHGPVRAGATGDTRRGHREDEGPGIPEDKLTAIFDRFYTERPAGEKFGTHSGLGLSISKQIVEAHRGEIFARNRHAEGEAGGEEDARRHLHRAPAPPP